MSFDEFISRPKYEIESILRITQAINEKKMKANQSVINELEQTKQKTKPPNFSE